MRLAHMFESLLVQSNIRLLFLEFFHLLLRVRLVADSRCGIALTRSERTMPATMPLRNTYSYLFNNIHYFQNNWSIIS